MITSVPRLPSLPPRSTLPTAPYIANTALLRRSLLVVKASVGGEGQFFYSHLRWRGILKPSSAPLWASSRICAWTTHIKVGGRSRKSAYRHLHKTAARRYGQSSFAPLCPNHRSQDI